MCVNRTAIVTGASSGIGRAIAKELGRNNIFVILVARREERLKVLKEEIESDGGSAEYIVCDLMQENAVQYVVDKAYEITDSIDIMVSAAGRSAMTLLDDLKPRTWYSTIHLNLNVPYEFSRRLLPKMKEKNQGWFINISSEVACTPMEYTGVYGVSKAGLNRLTELIDLEYRDFNIHSYAICPGWVKSEFTDDPDAYGVSEEDLLKPEDIADYVYYLCNQRDVVRLNPIVEMTPLKSSTSARESIKKFIIRRSL